MTQNKKPLLVLASASPRRQELIGHLHRPFVCQVSDVEEVITKTAPDQVVCELSLQKAQAVAHTLTEEALVIGADTVVACDGKILGKPKDRQDAVRMLQLLSGRTHSVYTGVTICYRQAGEWQAESFAEETKVTFYPLTEEEIERYVDSQDPMDKAGAYGIQSGAAVFVQGIQGDYNTVVGLPVAALYQKLKEIEA